MLAKTLRKAGWVSFLLVFALLAGCQKSRPGGKLSGTITFDGRPIKGAITLTPVDEKGYSTNDADSGGTFLNGKYSFDGISPGRKAVGIRSGDLPEGRWEFEDGSDLMYFESTGEKQTTKIASRDCSKHKSLPCKSLIPQVMVEREGDCTN